ncbi:MAG TPA: TonB-dependent receptor, partial [Bryobacteraceae bacterium]|nr:TonB-dependent receptor [Bryobacteraceae bacterium]
TVVSIRYGFNRFPNMVRAVSEGFNPVDLSFSPTYSAALMEQKFPRIEMQNFTRAANSALGSGDTSQTVYHSRNFLASVSKFMGRHSLKAGFDYRTINIDGWNFGSSAGRFEFDDTFTRRNPLSRDGSGSDLASLLLGYPARAEAQLSTKLFNYVRYYSGYIHDDFRVSNRLTINAGIRYEYETGLRERNNNFISGFDPSIANPVGEQAGVDIRGALLYAGVDGNATQCCSLGTRRFAPRVGAAFKLNDKTTLRGGYGLFYAPARYDLFNPLGYTQVSEYVASNDGNLTPAGSISNPFPNGLLAPAGNTAGLRAGIGRAVDFYWQDAEAGRVHQFSFDIQRELPLGIAIAAGYVGSRSSHLAPSSTAATGVNLNQLDPQYLSLGSSLLQPVPNPFYQKGGAFAVGSATVARNQLLRPHPQFASVNALYYDFNHARYDSLAVKAQKRFSAGLSFLTTWTWSKNYDASFGSGNTFTAVPSSAPQNVYDLDAEYGLAIVDVPHRWVSTVSYELPFGKGKAWLGSNRALDYAVGGWQINVVTSFQSGFPLAIVQQNLNSALGFGAQRPNATGVSPEVEGSVQDRLDGYLNRAAFSQAPQFTFGNLSRTIDYRGPGQANWDVSMFKTFEFAEGFRAQFRAEAMNALNSPIFNGPDTNLGSASFGKITRQANFPRYIQLGVRFYF